MRFYQNPYIRIGLAVCLFGTLVPLLWTLPSAAERPLVEQAVAADAATAEAARNELRALGPNGFSALLEAHEEAVTQLREGRAHAYDPRVRSLRAAIDTVSGQRDGHASRLFWHTDLETAKERARAEDKPILSLRLLGNLDEEMSCANSRFFRLVLYANEGVSEVLRSHYVLHWSSERPAPRITIDMGDGRAIESTITGNSVHYLLDASGNPVDALVGLFSPEAFLSELEVARTIWRDCQGDSGCLRHKHRLAETRLGQEWDRHRAQDPRLPPLQIAQRQVLPNLEEEEAEEEAEEGADEEPIKISAAVAMRLTIGKRAVETPMLDALQPNPTRYPAVEQWVRTIAERDAQIWDSASRALLRLKSGVEDSSAQERRLAELVAQDTVLNRFLFRNEIHRLFQDDANRSFSSLNRVVYRELLRTPASDPWLGMRPNSVFDGIERRRHPAPDGATR